ncbi:DUF3459 domain-containing protein, partial [Microbacterium gubbeenense]
DGSTLELYRALLRLRREQGLGTGGLEWLESPAGTLSFRNGDVTVLANVSADPVDLPAGRVLAASGPLPDGRLPSDTTVWVG